MSSEYISLSEATKLTNYSQDYISLLCRQKKLKGVKMGRNWVTTKKWIEDYINRTKGSGENIIPVKIENKDKLKDDSTETDLRLISNISKTGEKESKISKQKERVANPLLQENDSEAAFNHPLKKAYIQQLFFIKNIILATLVVSILSIGFIFYEDRISDINQSFSKFSIAQKILTKPNNFLGLFRMDKSDSGIVAGIETFVGEENDSEIENQKENNGLVIIPLEGEIDSEENQKFIEKLSSSFSDDVDINPSGDGVSGVITSGEDPDDSYLYLMVPMEEE